MNCETHVFLVDVKKFGKSECADMIADFNLGAYFDDDFWGLFTDPVYYGIHINPYSSVDSRVLGDAKQTADIQAVASRIICAPEEYATRIFALRSALHYLTSTDTSQHDLRLVLCFFDGN